MSQVKCFITNQSNLDYSPLQDRYGSIIMMTQGFHDFSSGDGVEKLYQKVKKYLESSTPDDILVLSGASIISLVITNFWLNKHGVARVLAFSTKQKDYQEVILTKEIVGGYGSPPNPTNSTTPTKINTPSIINTPSKK